MCGRTTSTLARDTLARLLQVDEVDAPELPISWNVAPTQPVYAVASNSTGARKLRALRWGLVPSWASDPRIGSRLINARSETLAKRPAFRPLITSRRALLPFSGFYEWRRWPSAARARRQPYYFSRTDGRPLVFAGLWDIWRDAEGNPLRTCTIITTGANDIVAPVHNRMPVVLAEDAWGEWLRPQPLPADRLNHLLGPAPQGLLQAWPVSTGVNNARANGPALVLPAMEDADPEAFSPTNPQHGTDGLRTTP